MPKGPQGQKRPADGIGCAVLVGKIATGEEQEGVPYAAPSKGSAGGNARAQRLSTGERSKIAKAAAQARWNKERRADMTNQERLMTALFANPAREHVDVKFFVLGGMDLTADRLCEEAVGMLEQMDNGQGDTEFAEAFEQREVAEFIASI